MSYCIDKDWLAGVIRAIKLFPRRTVKAIKVSQGYFELVKQMCEVDAEAKQDDYIGTCDMIPIIIDDEVTTWKVEYVEDIDNE